MAYNYSGEGEIYNTGLFEFESVFTVDESDLNSVASGSGVHLNRAVEIDLGILDRSSGDVSTQPDFLDNSYVQKIDVDILDITGGVKYSDFLVDYKSNFLAFTEYDNFKVFGDYAKHFGVKIKLEDRNSGIHTSEFYFYGNEPIISGIAVQDSTGTTSHTGSLSSKTAVNSTGQTGALTTTVTFLNDTNYISLDRLDIYYTDTSDFDLNLNPQPAFSRNLTNNNTQSFDLNEGDLPNGEAVYLHYVPYGNLGSGDSWSVGPYTFADNPITDENFLTTDDTGIFLTGITSGDITGALGYTPLSSETDDQTLDEVLAQGNTSNLGIDVGAITGSGNIFLHGDNQNIFFGGANTFVGESSNSQRLQLRGGGSNSSDTVIIDNDAKMGLGTIPSYGLHLKTNPDIFFEGNIAQNDYLFDGGGENLNVFRDPDNTNRTYLTFDKDDQLYVSRQGSVDFIVNGSSQLNTLIQTDASENDVFFPDGKYGFGFEGVEPSALVHVSGDSFFDGDLDISGALTVTNDDTGVSDIFSVDGVNGRLFGVTDEVTGTIFSVNDAAGLPILEVESTSTYDKITIGEYGTDALVISGTNSALFNVDVEMTGTLDVTGDITMGGETVLTGITSGDITGALGYTPLSSETDDQTLDEVLAQGNTSTRDMSVGDISGTSLDITTDVTVTGDVEADEFIGDLRGAVSFRAKAGEALSAGEVVYISGIAGNTTVVAKADANDPNKMPAFGVSKETVNANANVRVVNFGSVTNLDTSNYSEGDELFVSDIAGQLTGIAPTGEASALQKMAKVTRSDNSAGSITVMGAGRTNAVPNLNEGRLFVGNSSNQAVADGTIFVDIASSEVGIGTTTPSAKLELSDSSYIDLLNLNRSGVNSVAFRVGNLGSGDVALDVRLPSTNSRVGIRGAMSVGAGYADGANTGIANGLVVQGNVGIGTTSPSSKLHIKAGSSNWDGGLLLEDDSDGKASILTQEAGKLYIGYAASAASPNSASSIMVLENTGNVGIGTTSPSSLLHLSSSGPTVLTIEADTDNVTETDNAQIVLKQDGGLVVGRIGFESGTNDLEFINESNNSLSLGTSNQERLTIDSSGNVNITAANAAVGIGTTTPSGQFHLLYSDGTARSSVVNNTTVGLRVENSNPNGVSQIHLRAGDADAHILVEDVGSNAADMFFSVDGTEPAMVIKNAGNVGIGTTSPARKLSIQGDGNTALSVTSPNTSYVQLALGDTDDDNYGQIILDNSSNKLQIQNGGGGVISDRGITLDSSENVGIGTASPNAKLQINDNVRIGNTSTGVRFYIQGVDEFRADALDVSANGWNSLHLRADGTDGLFLEKDTNNVGIGTTNPTYKLETIGSGYFGGVLTTKNTGDSSEVKLVPSGGSPYIQFLRTGTTDWRIKSGGNGSYQILDTSIGGTSVMTVQANGNVGIGINSPAEKLTVIGDILIDNGGNSTLYLGKGAEGVDGVTKIKAVQTGADTDQLGIAFNVHPNTAGSAVSEEAMRIDHDGNVGIGDTTPAYKLDVIGTLRTTSAAYFNNDVVVTNNLTLTGANKPTFTTPDDTVYTPSHDWVTATPFNAAWHDLIAFDRNYTTTQEISTDGTNFSSDTLELGLFDQKDKTKYEVVGNGERAVRWTWTGVAYNSARYFHIAAGFSSPAPSCTVKIETSSDGSTWTEIHSSSGITFSAINRFCYVDPTVGSGGDNYVRLTIDKGNTDTKTINLTSIKMLTQRLGDQGKGREDELPFYYDKNQNIGIGITSPSYPLHVVGSVKLDGVTYLGYPQVQDDGRLRFGDGNDYSIGYNSADDTLRIADGNSLTTSPRITLDSSGNVGIGTTSPAEKLEVSGSVRVGNLKIQNANGGRIGLNRNTATGAIYNNSFGGFQIQNNSAAGFEIQGYNTSGTQTGIISMNQSDGNVGIGTTSPQTPLHVQDTGGSGIRVSRTGNSAYLQLFPAYSSVPTIMGQGAGGLHLGYQSNTSGIRIDTNNNVGIGTTTPNNFGFLETAVEISAGSSSSTTLQQAGLVLSGSSDADDADDFAYLSFTNHQSTISNGRVAEIRAYKNGSDVDTGELAFFTVLSERMRIDKDGNVGIGTTSPSKKLDVNGDWVLDGINGGHFENYLYGTQLDISENNSGGWARSNKIVTSDTSGEVFFGVYGNDTTLTRSYWTIGDPSSINTSGYNTGNGIILLKNGNVGIGTTSPARSLHLYSPSNNYIRLQTTTVNGYSGVEFANDAKTWTLGVINNDTFALSNAAQFAGGYPFQIESSAPNNSFIVKTSGNVGIGTTSPSATLDVNGAGNFSGGTVVSGVDTKTNVGVSIAKGDYLVSNDGNYLRNIIGQAANGNIEIGQATALIGDIILKPGSSGAIAFYGSGSEDARFDSNGRLGIGTTSAEYELHVIGTASFTDTVAGAYFEENASHESLKSMRTGTILVMNEDGDLVPCSKEDDTMVFGVVKKGYKQPIIMGAEPIKVTGPIKVGDYITTSDVLGHGKKSNQPYPFGTIIAQAMESGDGESYNIKAMIRKM